MNARGHILLHYAVDLMGRLIAFKRLPRLRVRQVMRSAILEGELTVSWMGSHACHADRSIIHGEPAAVIPGSAFGRIRAADAAFMDSALPTDPKIDALRKYRNMICVVERSQFLDWMRNLDAARIDLDMPEIDIPADNYFTRSIYREPPEQPFIPLSAALSWADDQVSLGGQEFVDAAIFAPDVDERDRRHADVLKKLLYAASNEQLQMRGRFYDGDGQSNGIRSLLRDDLYNFARYDCSEEALLRGSGIAWSNCDEYRDDDVSREERGAETQGIKDVEVDRAALLALHPPKPVKKTGLARKRAAEFVRKAVIEGFGHGLSKAELRKLADVEIPGLSQNAFDDAWAACAPDGWKTPGRKSIR